MLKLTDIHSFYGHIQALKGISLNVREGEIVSLLGANGAGKTTTLNTISGLVQPKKGSIELNGVPMLMKSASQVVKSGIVHCPENRRVFPLFTVEENLLVGAYTRRDNNVKKDLEKVYNTFPRLKERQNQKAGTLSGGEQQMLAIGRSLMGTPKLLLLDEPSLGIAPILVQEIFEIIKRINQDGVSILLVEQNAHMALELSDYSYVLENGRLALSGKSKDLKKNDDIRKLYLGESVT